MRLLQALWEEAPFEREEDRLLRPFRAAFRALPTIDTPRLRLRPPSMADAADLYAYARDEAVSRFVLWERHRTLRDSKAALRGMIAANRQGRPGTFALELRAEARMVGTLGFQWLDPENLSSELGYSIARRLWGQGLAAEALLAAVRYAFETLGLQRLEARHDVLNPASGRVLEKAGFTCEGIQLSSVSLKGRRADMRCWALLREDWQGGGEGGQAAHGAGEDR